MDISTGFGTGTSRFEGATVSDGGLWQDMVWSNGFYLDRITPFDKPGANPRLGGFQEHLPSDIAEDVEATREYTRFTGSTTLNFNTGDFNLGGMSASLTQRAVFGMRGMADDGHEIVRTPFAGIDAGKPHLGGKFGGDVAVGHGRRPRPALRSVLRDAPLRALLSMRVECSR